MGHGNYSQAAHAALVADRAARPASEVFRQNRCHPLMNPGGLKVRESRDSADHPDSLGILFALDVTGSMGVIPRQLATAELPRFMALLQACRIPDPQILFVALGDARSDDAPLQVGQFESTAELMDQWLTWTWLEGGGGGNGHESYDLGFYLAAQHTDMDCVSRRGKRGYLFMTGDELPYPAISKAVVQSVFGEPLDDDIPLEEVIAAAAESFHLFFLIPDLARRSRCEKRWRELLGDRVICMEDPADTCAVAAALVGLTEKALADADAVAGVLADAGFDPDRIGRVVRALRPYAQLLSGDAGPSARAAAGAAAAPLPWWRKLFG